MIFFDFNGVSEDFKSSKVTPTVVSWFTEEDKSDAQVSQGQTFRTLLFGFLIKALWRHGIL